MSDFPIAAQRQILRLEKRNLKLEQDNVALTAKYEKRIAKLQAEVAELQAENRKLKTQPMILGEEERAKLIELQRAANERNRAKHVA